MQVLAPIYERQFSVSSYGFRSKRSAHQALNQCKGYITDGYRYAVDMDLEKFFDTVNQSKLIEVLSRTVKDGRVISLIHKYLNAGVVIRNKFEETKVGVPQGGPLLSNPMQKLTEFRADIVPYIEVKLFLRVNREKNVIREPQEKVWTTIIKISSMP